MPCARPASRPGARNHRLLDPEVAEVLIRRATLRSLLPILFFTVSIPVALLIHPYAAEVVWGLSTVALFRI